MKLLFQFLSQYKTFISLIVLESICFLMIVQSNSYHRSKYVTFSSELVMQVIDTKNQVSDYFDLPNQNNRLAEENVKLRQQLLNLTDSSFMKYILSDSVSLGIKAKVIDNSLFFRNNYLTLNKGSLHGLQKGMGVVGPNGVVGQIGGVTKHYSTVVSVLHSRTMISVQHQVSGTLCSVIWDGNDPRFALLKYMPRHINVVLGDTIFTSGYNTTYPPKQQVGIVSKVHLSDDATFYDVSLKLTTNFHNLSHVYILALRGKKERDSLTVKINEQYE